MTWNELIERLQQIPEHRREEQAVLFSEGDNDHYVIDEMELVDMEEHPINWACNVGDEGMQTTYALIP